MIYCKLFQDSRNWKVVQPMEPTMRHLISSHRFQWRKKPANKLAPTILHVTSMWINSWFATLEILRMSTHCLSQLCFLDQLMSTWKMLLMSPNCDVKIENKRRLIWLNIYISHPWSKTFARRSNHRNEAIRLMFSLFRRIQSCDIYAFQSGSGVAQRSFKSSKNLQAVKNVEFSCLSYDSYGQLLILP